MGEGQQSHRKTKIGIWKKWIKRIWNRIKKQTNRKWQWCHTLRGNHRGKLMQLIVPCTHISRPDMEDDIENLEWSGSEHSFRITVHSDLKTLGGNTHITDLRPDSVASPTSAMPVAVYTGQRQGVNCRQIKLDRFYECPALARGMPS